MPGQVVLAETVLEFEYVSAFDAYAHVLGSLPFEFIAGHQYTITWDGVAYTRTAFAFSAADGSSCIAVGNPLAAGESRNGDPFAIVCETSNSYLYFISTEASDTHTVSILLAEGIVLKDRNGEPVAYYGIETVTFDTTTEGKQQTYTKGVAMEGLEIEPDFSGGDMSISAPEGMLVKSATIKKPEALRPENVRNGEEIGGVIGAFPVYPFIEYTRNESGEIVAAKMYGFTTIPDGCFAYMTALEIVDTTESPGITSIGNYAFYECTALSGFTIPDGVTTIGSNAFRKTSNLTSIIIPDSVRSIGSHAFYQSKIDSINIPDGVTNIEKYTFTTCSLKSITIPNSVTSIGEMAFASSLIESIIIPGSVKTIGPYAFQNCSKLTSVTIQDGVTYIDTAVFNICTGITSLTIPASVKSIGRHFIGNTTALKSVTFKDTSGWYVTQTKDSTSGTNVTVTNPSNNATYFTSTYFQYYWYDRT